MITPEQFKVLLPIACAWAEEQESIIRRYGVPLSPAQTADAIKIGVAHPEKVRLMKTTRIPAPDRSDVCTATDANRLIYPFARGLTFRYGIFIRADCWGDRQLVFHELVHTAQYERLGGLHGHPEKGLITRMEIFGQKGNTFSVRGVQQDWGGQGKLNGMEGYYDWKFGNGKTGRTTFTVNTDGTIKGHVLGSGIDWVYIAKKSK